MFSYPASIEEPCSTSDLDYIHADDKVIGRFSKAISFRTVSYEPGRYERAELLKFQQFLVKGEYLVHLN